MDMCRYQILACMSDNEKPSIRGVGSTEFITESFISLPIFQNVICYRNQNTYVQGFLF